MNSKDDVEEAGLAAAALPLMETPSARRPISRVRGWLPAVIETLREPLEGPWQRERQRIRATFGAQAFCRS